MTPQEARGRLAELPGDIRVGGYASAFAYGRAGREVLQHAVELAQILLAAGTPEAEVSSMLDAVTDAVSGKIVDLDGGKPLA